MIPKECKRLAEVDFPIAVVSKHSAREKSIRHGHPSTLHLWWARRPLAACRAMLLGLLLPDPCDEHCPSDFKKKAGELLPQVQGTVGSRDEDLRRALLKFIGDFSNWDLSANQVYLDVSRGLVKAAHPEETPLVVDPFAGGGSIPLEALRLGCEAFASDLNPVACLILKVMLEDIPRHGPELAEELRRVGVEIRNAAEKELAEFYPPDPDGSRPIAYLWARTVRCETPNCGADIPLVRSFWLSKKAGRKRAIRYKVVRPQDGSPYIEFEVFKPESDEDIPDGTVTRAKATCICCNIVLSPERVRAQLRDQRGGADVIFDKDGARIGGARLLAVVILKPGEQGRHYRLAAETDYTAVWKAMKALDRVAKEKLPNGLNPVPDEPLPKERERGSSGFRVLLYGFSTFGDLFTIRQKLMLVTLTNLSATSKNSSVSALLALAMNKIVMQNSNSCRWKPSGESLMDTFGRQALPIVWDFAESNPLAGSTGDFGIAIDWISQALAPTNWREGRRGQSLQADAIKHPLPDEAATIWFTDPPYYDNIAYADLSDFFYVWIKRTLPGYPLLQDPFNPKNPLTPKDHEAIQDPARNKGKQFFEMTMEQAFAEGHRVLNNSGISCVVFAHKTTEGWEALIAGMLNAGWVITASWPITTEMKSRLLARDTAALASSVHLICRPRSDNASVGDWGGVLRELPNRVGDWMEHLQSEGIRGADLVFACIGPALEIFSRYSKVETAEGREVKLSEYLEKVWEVVGRTALEQILGTAEAKARNGAAGALEEDARLTALFLWTLQSTNGANSTPSPQPSPARGEGEVSLRRDEGDSDTDDEEDEAPKGKPKGFGLPFDVVRRFAQPLGIHLPEWEDRLIKTEKGTVRLLSISERAKLLFGEEGAEVMADRLEKDPSSAQLSLFENVEESAVSDLKLRGRKRKKGADISEESLKTRREATTLDRVHAAMILQASGRANALRALLKAEQDRSPDFLRLANALSALYPKESEEKRLLDAMLLAVPR